MLRPSSLAIVAMLAVPAIAGGAFGGYPTECDITRTDPSTPLVISCFFYCIEGATLHVAAEGLLGGARTDCPGNDAYCSVDPARVKLACNGSTRATEEGPGRCRLWGESVFRCWNS